MSGKIRKESKGITLIALVITIIVLLILAGVAIVTLTGDNGILTQAGKAKTETNNAEAEEQVNLAILGSKGTDGKLNLETLKKNLTNQGISYEDSDDFPLTITINGEKKKINSNGTITDSLKSIEEAKTEGTVFEKETTLEDKYENQIKIPARFKIASDSATEVTKGIVIEDAKYTNTIGSQFVWIPVGEVTGSVNGVKKTETIKLSRYTFGSDGTPTDQGDNIIDSYYQELATSDCGNAVAKDIEAFKSSANNNHGYYIGRYEAGITGYDGFDEDNRNWAGTNIQVVCKAGQEVWNYITQPKASEVSKNMYTGNKFTSDLINSYSWDTAIVFIQKFGDESNSQAYSKTEGTSITYNLQTTGTNILRETGNVDKQCNIYDMAGNCFEWSTETYIDFSNPYVTLGGNWIPAGTYTSEREYHKLDSWGYNENAYSFRPILYL